jgi:phosphatidylinositol alpha-1,6-mannosyltransferase
VCVVNNGTDIARFGSGEALAYANALRARLGAVRARTLLTVARLVERKGIDTVIKALPELCLHYADLHYFIVGQGPDRKRLEALARSNGVADRCHFLGAVSHQELPGVYMAGDIFVMPARAAGPSVEGFGLAFCEASASSRPVIGTNSGGIPDAVKHGETGLLVPPDDPQAFGDAVARLLTEPAYAEQLGAQGRRYIEQNGTWEHAATRLYQYMEQTCERS